MTSELLAIAGQHCLLVSADSSIATVQDGLDLVGEAMSDGATVVVMPVEAVDPAFFQLRSGIAGEIAQKFVNYRMRLAIVGAIDAYITASNAFRDFVVECARNDAILFEPDMASLEARLGRVGVR